ncbi:MAG: hypothetical protein ABS75_14595 [Pelagibacterium sp. SCN 63-23]|nr:MAG: hypothetical protein ABS75_14595 [Pelagibacterium sp. SCN 63-23]
MCTRWPRQPAPGHDSHEASAWRDENINEFNDFFKSCVVLPQGEERGFARKFGRTPLFSAAWR